MKLHELGARRPTEQIAKTLRGQYESQVDFDRLSESQTRHMLDRVQGLLREHKSSVSRHFSERNPDYMKLVMLEQALTARLDEKYMGFDKTVAAIKKSGSAKDPEAVAAAIGRKKYGKAKFQKAAAAGKKLGERRIMEASEIQTAQVVLASQDMVDRIQGMMEDISEMQFKDLPALTNSIKNDMGTEQASQFNAQAAAALTNLLAAVQAGKTELESAQGVLTGQAPTIPGADASAMPATAPTPGEEELDLSIDANLPADEEEPEGEVGAETLGRERR
jgi:hypothetical protein